MVANYFAIALAPLPHLPPIGAEVFDTAVLQQHLCPGKQQTLVLLRLAIEIATPDR